VAAGGNRSDHTGSGETASNTTAAIEHLNRNPLKINEPRYQRRNRVESRCVGVRLCGIWKHADRVGSIREEIRSATVSRLALKAFLNRIRDMLLVQVGALILLPRRIEVLLMQRSQGKSRFYASCPVWRTRSAASNRFDAATCCITRRM
jgi:hypothetical protein